MERTFFSVEIGFDSNFQIALVCVVGGHTKTNANLLAFVNRYEVLKYFYLDKFLFLVKIWSETHQSETSIMNLA